jgi:hypothetical protein
MYQCGLDIMSVSETDGWTVESLLTTQEQLNVGQDETMFYIMGVCL